MVLLDCPECGRQISTAATACPACGYPLAIKAGPPPVQVATNTEPARVQRPSGMPGITALVGMIFGIAALVIQLVVCGIVFSVGRNEAMGMLYIMGEYFLVAPAAALSVLLCVISVICCRRVSRPSLIGLGCSASAAVLSGVPLMI